MKKSLIVVSFLAGMLMLATAPPAQGSVAVSISFFHEQLSTQGQWVVAASYGEVWVPAGVASGWAPYVDGEWVWTDYGWTWASYDPWGDIPFHYGTWVWVDPYGWVWIPGTIWAPAWVTWAYTDDYIGWAPVPPSFALSAGGYVGGPIVVSQTRYVFVPTTQFVGVKVSTARVPVQQNATIFTRATKVTNYTVSSGVVHTGGPPSSKIEKVTGKRIERVSIERAKTKPTTLADSGLARSQGLRVVAPAKERVHAGKEPAGHRPERAAKDLTKSTSTHEKPQVERQGQTKLGTESHRAKKPEKLEASRGAKPGEQGETPATVNRVPKGKPEPKHEPPQAATVHGNPPPHEGPPPGQVKKEKASRPGPGQGQEKKDKDKEKNQ